MGMGSSGASDSGAGEMPKLNPVDITPPHLNFNPRAIEIHGDYAYIAGGVNGLHILDISDPENAEWAGWVDTPGNTSDIDISGDLAFVACGVWGLKIYDISEPESPGFLKSVNIPQKASRITVEGDYAFVTDPDLGLRIVDISDPENAYVAGSVSFGRWVEGVAVSGGYAYVLSGDIGLSIVDIDPVESAHVVNSVLTDVWPIGLKVYIFDNYAYVPCGDLTIIDIGQPDSAYKCEISNEKLGRVFNIATDGDTAYAITDEGYMHVLDISNTAEPLITATVEIPKERLDIAISGGYAYLTGSTGIQIVNIEMPSSAYVVETIHTLGDAKQVEISGEIAYLRSQTSDIMALQIGSPDRPEFLGQVEFGREPHNRKPSSFDISGDYIYALWPQSEFQILEIQSGESVIPLATIEMPSYEENSYTGYVKAAGGYAFVFSHRPNNMNVIIDIDPPESAHIAGTIERILHCTEVVTDGEYAYFTEHEGLTIVDINPIEDAFIIKTIKTPGYAFDIAVSNGYAFIADSGQGLAIIDVDPVESAHFVRKVFMPEPAVGVEVYGDYAFVADSESGLKILDISEPERAKIIGNVRIPGSAKDVVVDGNYAYVAAGSGGLRIIKLW